MCPAALDAVTFSNLVNERAAPQLINPSTVLSDNCTARRPGRRLRGGTPRNFAVGAAAARRSHHGQDSIGNPVDPAQCVSPYRGTQPSLHGAGKFYRAQP